MKTKRAYLHTWGCQMNVHDTEKISGLLKDQGYSLTQEAEEADVIVLNTCSIRQKAEQKFYSRLGELRSLKKRNPAVKIAVAGCIAQQEGERIFARYPYVDYLFGPQNIGRLAGLLKEDSAPGTDGPGSLRTALEDNHDLALTDLPVDRNDGLRAWVTIMYGCNNYCTYCVVPATRGREQSRPFENILAEVKELAGQGYKEVTLLGQNVNSYQGGCTFAGLLARLNEVEGIKRIRFVTSHPRDFTEELMLSIRDLPRVCEHIHLPLQSGSTRILRLMNRKYLYEDYQAKVERFREILPRGAVTTDIITGFPTETHEDHLMTIKALKRLRFDGIFAFKYSPRPYTKAKLMESQVDEGEKTARLHEILSLQDDITLEINQRFENRTVEVLVEGPAGEDVDAFLWTGRTRTNKVVTFSPDGRVVTGDMVQMEIVKGRRHTLQGRISQSGQALPGQELIDKDGLAVNGRSAGGHIAGV